MIADLADKLLGSSLTPKRSAREARRASQVEHRHGFGFLLPSINDDPANPSGVGAIAGMSQQWPWMTVHLNVAAAIAAADADAFVSMIVEGPPTAPPCGVFTSRTIGHDKSALVGAIWQVRDNIAFDVGLRAAGVATSAARVASA